MRVCLHVGADPDEPVLVSVSEGSAAHLRLCATSDVHDIHEVSQPTVPPSGYCTECLSSFFSHAGEK